MLLITFILALVINFLGYIPLGNINLTTMQMSVNRGMRQTMHFLITFSVVDVVFTYILMHFADWFADHKTWLNALEYLLVLVFLILGSLSLHAATHPKKVKKSTGGGVKYGILLGIFNPMQIPFWMIGGTYLISHNYITTEGLGIEVFALGAGLGAFCSLYLFARFAKYIQNRFSLSNRIINRSIAIVFFALALIYIIKIVATNLK